MAGSNTSTPLAFGLLGVGTLLVMSGLQGKSVGDILTGKSTHTFDPAAGADAGAKALGVESIMGPAAKPITGLPSGLASYDGLPVARWIVKPLTWARESHYWTGHVTSGWRDPNRVITPSPGLPVAPQGKSNHSGQGYPSGAVDVSDPEGLEKAMKHYPYLPKLIRGTAINDPIHFSATGR